MTSLLYTRHAIQKRSQPTRFSRAIRFLHQSYTSAFYLWEVAEMVHRFLLVGLFVVVPWQAQCARTEGTRIHLVVLVWPATPHADPHPLQILPWS